MPFSAGVRRGLDALRKAVLAGTYAEIKSNRRPFCDAIL
jgi:hypothetical protein